MVMATNRSGMLVKAVVLTVLVGGRGGGSSSSSSSSSSSRSSSRISDKQLVVEVIAVAVCAVRNLRRLGRRYDI